MTLFVKTHSSRVRITASRRAVAFFVFFAMAVSGLSAPSLARTHHHRAGRVVHSAYVPPRNASILMDADNGVILEQENADVQLHPASLTKTMTLLLTFEALERGDLRLGDAVPISNHAASMSPSKLGLSPGSSIRVQDAIYAVVTHSANDIAVALAEKLGGTEGRFAIMMNRRAADIGMTRSHFANASGLPNPEQISTARDMAILARYIITAHPQYYRYFATHDFTYRGEVYHNHNHLMDTYRGMDGLKTGFIQQSGFNLIASARRDGHRLISVVFGGRSTASRNAEVASLLDQGFAHVESPAYAGSLRRAAPILAATPVAPPLQIATAGTVSNTAAEDDDPEVRGGAFGAVVGQGDADPEAATRLQTGLIAINGVRQNAAVTPAAAPAPVAAAPAIVNPDTGIWSIQIGAYTSRVTTDRAMQTALASLPPVLAKADPVIVPLKTQSGWMFRGRLSGYSRDQAFAACKLLANCTPVSPLAN